MLPGSGVFGLLDDKNLVLRHLLRERKRGGQRGISRRAALKTLETREKFGHIERLALRHKEIAVHVAQRPRGVAGYIDTIWVRCERHPEAGVAGGERLAIEVVIA